MNFFKKTFCALSAVALSGMFAACDCTSASNDDPESSGTMTDSRDGQTYKIVTIGTQTWMAENLNYDYNEGTAKSYCYDNESSNCDKYGRLYMWSAAMDSAAVFSTAGKGCGYESKCNASEIVRGVCPKGWHLPSDDEWNTLFAAVGGVSTAGTKMKSTSGWFGDGKVEDSFGFAVLPAGRRGYDGESYFESTDASFWSSSVECSFEAYAWDFNYANEAVSHGENDMDFGFSVRCVKD